MNNLHVKQTDRNVKDQTKEEHRLEKNSLLKTYGGELELLYVQSIQVRFSCYAIADIESVIP